MNESENKPYDPAEDDNQGVVQLLAQGEKATAGVPQAEALDPEQILDKAPGQETGVEDTNDELLVEEDVEKGRIGMDNESQF